MDGKLLMKHLLRTKRLARIYSQIAYAGLIFGGQLGYEVFKWGSKMAVNYNHLATFFLCVWINGRS